jgi:hypothetical protein
VFAKIGGTTFFDENITLNHGLGSAKVTFNTPGNATGTAILEAVAMINVPGGSGLEAITIAGETSIPVTMNTSTAAPGTGSVATSGSAAAFMAPAGQTAAALNMAQVPAPVQAKAVGSSALPTSHRLSADDVGATAAHDKVFANLADSAAFNVL